MQKFIAILHILLFGFLISCTQKKAPVINRGDHVYYKVSKDGYHIVENGETLFSISRKYGFGVDDLSEVNNLSNSASIKTGQKLKIAKSKTQTAKINKDQSVAYKKATEVKKQQAKNEKLKAASQEKEEKIAAKINDKNNQFSWPVRGIVVSKFGPKTGGLYNDGINIKANSGSQVKATEDGIVAYVGDELRGYGNLIIIKHSGGWISAYAHLEKTKVARGTKVNKGQLIATVGSTGNVKYPQLYFGLRKGREAVNPQLYL